MIVMVMIRVIGVVRERGLGRRRALVAMAHEFGFVAPVFVGANTHRARHLEVDEQDRHHEGEGCAHPCESYHRGRAGRPPSKTEFASRMKARTPPPGSWAGGGRLASGTDLGEDS